MPDTMIDLFGVEIPVHPPDHSNESDYQKFKRLNHYRRSEDKEVRCKTCRYAYQTQGRGPRRWTKCHLIGCSSSPATDIAQRNVCDKWERRQEQIEAQLIRKG